MDFSLLWAIGIISHLMHNLSLESRKANDQRSMGEILLYLTDEMLDITWIQAFQMLLEMFRTILADNTELTEEKTLFLDMTKSPSPFTVLILTQTSHINYSYVP